MSEEQPAPESDAPEQPQEGPEQPEAFDADYVAKLRKEAARYRTEAKANAEAAKKLAEIEEANKSEQQKLTDRLASLEQEATQAKAEALRFKIASKFGVTEEDTELFLTGTDEETLTKQAERLAARNEDAAKPRAPKPDPNQGRRSGGSASTADQFAAAVGGLLQ
jgi:hypothetical protein